MGSTPYTIEQPLSRAQHAPTCPVSTGPPHTGTYRWSTKHARRPPRLPQPHRNAPSVTAVRWVAREKAEPHGVAPFMSPTSPASCQFDHGLSANEPEWMPAVESPHPVGHHKSGCSR